MTTPPKLTGIYARNFRNIESINIELPNMVVITGPNSSGKTNVLRLIKFLSDITSQGPDVAVRRQGDISAVVMQPNGDAKPTEVGFTALSNEHLVEYGFEFIQVNAHTFHVTREYASLRPHDQSGEVTRINFPPGRLFHITNNRPLEDLPAHMGQALNQATEMISHLADNLYTPPFKPEFRTGNDVLAKDLHELMDPGHPFKADLLTALSEFTGAPMSITVDPNETNSAVQVRHCAGTHTWMNPLDQEPQSLFDFLKTMSLLLKHPSPPVILIDDAGQALHPMKVTLLAEHIIETSLRSQVIITTNSPQMIDAMPLDAIRAVQTQDGSTHMKAIGPASPHQLKSVQEDLFTAGEIHSMEFLQPEE